MTTPSQFLPRSAPSASNWWRRILESCLARIAPASRAYLAELRRACKAEHRFSQLRRRDPQALAREGIACQGVPRRIFEEFFAGQAAVDDRLGGMISLARIPAEPLARRRSPMSRSIAFLPRYTAGIALAVVLVLAPAALPSGGGNAEARTKAQCNQRFGNCVIRCSASAGEKYGPATKKAVEAYQNCENRTCRHQHTSCVENASDAKKPTKAVAEPSGTGPKTKVQPKWQPGKVNVPDKLGPVARVPPKVQPTGGVQSWPGSSGPTFRKNR